MKHFVNNCSKINKLGHIEMKTFGKFGSEIENVRLLAPARRQSRASRQLRKRFHQGGVGKPQLLACTQFSRFAFSFSASRTNFFRWLTLFNSNTDNSDINKP